MEEREKMFVKLTRWEKVNVLEIEGCKKEKIWNVKSGEEKDQSKQVIVRLTKYLERMEEMR